MNEAITPADPGRDDVPALPPLPGPEAAPAPRTLASYERRDVRTMIAALRGE
jgi:hypothetical protein